MLSHLIEFRRRMLQIVGFFVGLFLLFFLIAPTLFHIVVLPLLQALPAQDGIIATQITAPLFTPIKLAADLALFATAPFALFHAWRFTSPALYRHERKSLRWAIVGSLLLFCAGVLFCFFVILPFMLHFFIGAVPAGVKLMPDMIYTIDFITRMLLIFGFCFQIPLVCSLLVHIKLISLTTLKTIRPYIIVAAFIIGMLLTPPDVLSQIMLAIPLCLLYEFGIILSIVLDKTLRQDKIDYDRN